MLAHCASREGPRIQKRGSQAEKVNVVTRQEAKENPGNNLESTARRQGRVTPRESHMAALQNSKIRKYFRRSPPPPPTLAVMLARHRSLLPTPFLDFLAPRNICSTRSFATEVSSTRGRVRGGAKAAASGRAAAVVETKSARRKRGKDARKYETLVGEAVKSKDKRKEINAHKFGVKKDYKKGVEMKRLEPHILSSRLRNLCAEGKLEDAVKTLKTMPLDAQNPPVWNTLIWECLKAERYSLGYKLFTEVRCDFV